MSKVSAWQKAEVVARVAGKQARRSRTLNAIGGGVRTTLRSFSHALHQLWLEVTGTLFLAIAAFGAIALVREYMKYETGRTTIGRVAIAVAFTLTFAWFGMTSFWRAKKKARGHETSPSSVAKRI